MPSRSAILQRDTRLAAALPDAQFAESHQRLIDAPVEQVWRAVNTVTLAELWLTKPLFLLRGARPAMLDKPLVEPPSPMAPVFADPPFYSVGAQISQPWRWRGAHEPPVAGLDELAAFAEPGWLKIGADWELIPQADGRTLVRTVTACAATSVGARRRFRAYWILIRLGSGAIRHGLLRAVARRAHAMEVRSAGAPQGPCAEGASRGSGLA